MSGDKPISFEHNVRPLFRDLDVDSMSWLLDLTQRDQVAEHAGAIVAQLEMGSMPCDGSWDEEKVALFRRWVAAGYPD
jgi:hypothetical protein